jgi:tRNA-splicing ligase RtcB
VGTAHNAAVTDRVRANRIWQSGTRAPILTGQLRRKLQHQFGSLGGGNHFLELQEDEEEGAWVMLHSGSRFLGVAIRDHYVGLGRSVDGIDPRTYRTVPHLPATSEAAADYLADVAYAVAFARASRREMLVRVLEVLGTLRLLQADQASLLDEAIDLEHNAVSVEEHWGERLYVHRKGATRAGTGLPGLIPGSMGSRSFVVEGRGNEHAFCSCSHGAGRAMSRAEAMRAISDEELCRSMEGVLYDHDGRLRDEAPAAYKDIGQVMRAQRDLVRIKHELRPMASIKGCT